MTVQTYEGNLQVAWDSSSLQALMMCPRSYQLGILEGWRGSSVDLEFGSFFASACERYQKLRLNDVEQIDAIVEVLEWIFIETADWGGHFETMWRCEGTSRYKNERGNAAKCPFSHMAKGSSGEYLWFPEPAPNLCGECGSGVAQDRRYIPNDKTKNRRTLIRTALWWMLDQPEKLSDGWGPIRFPDGRPAVELSFAIPLPCKVGDFERWGRVGRVLGQNYILCGHIDYIGRLGADGHISPTDNKTTTKYLNETFFASYNPSMQFDNYDLAAWMLWPELNSEGFTIDAAQVTQDGANFAKYTYHKTTMQREEQLETLKFWIGQAERYAVNNYWPMNKRNCWICAFKRVCSQGTEAERRMALATHFTQSPRWDPLQER